MIRLISAMKTDVTVQVRNRLYYIGPAFSVFAAGLLVLLAPTVGLAQSIPTAMILLVGGSTLLYVVGLITFEKEEGTLNAFIVSPLRIHEYLLSKVLTLTALATLESLIIIIGATLFIRGNAQAWIPFNVLLLLVGIIAMGVIYTLIGIIVMVRYDRFTDALVPVLAVAIPLQLPFLYYLGWLTHPIFLIVPTTAPLLLMSGAFLALSPWIWVYAVGYTLMVTIGFAYWAYVAFRAHVIMKAG
ncbi:MAG TPA: hypothetical protein DEF34_06795 [Desulfotomaculum sp.]|nr:MAG: hypothetical protein VR67_03775 [Peptococcaceae bacterium BRH_c8a]KJS75573.1 MAG: hypothetical protein JL56_07965 [Desulfotomaculum sp. BICA1-6]HBX23317.1 hypothetical protein [Desulfotomaculum sp.]